MTTPAQPSLFGAPAGAAAAQSIVGDRAEGALWGLVWGDVLGVPVEGWSAADIHAAYGRYDALPARYPDAVPAAKRARLRPPGIHSDDTQQALALLSVCRQGYSAAAWGACLVEGARQKAWRGTGRHFDKAVAQLQRGVDAKRSGQPSAGIGAAMRSAPLGALLRDQTRQLAVVCMETSAATHADLRSMALAYAVAWASAQLVNGRAVADVRAELPDAAAEAEDEWLSGRVAWEVDRAGRHQLSLVLARALAAAACAADADGRARAVVDYGARYVDKQFLPAHENHAFALLGGVHGLVVGLADDVEPAAALLDVVGRGEDTDTVAAIAGGLLGARFGAGFVQKARVLDAAAIEPYARLLRLGPEAQAPLEPLAALLQREAALTRTELTYQAETSWPK